MSEESQQLSVAELLARNGQSGAASGGGRRRRAGRGISVAELAGDIRPGAGGRRSAHSASDDEEAAAEYGATAVDEENLPGYDASGTDSSPAVSSTDDNRAPVGLYDLPDSGMSPMSGPIARYDPLAPPVEQAEEPPARPRRSRYRDDDESDSAPQSFTPEYFGIESHGSSDDGSRPGGRRRRRAEPEDGPDEFGPLGSADGRVAAEAPVPWEAGPPEPPGGGRTARRHAAEAADAESAWASDNRGFGPEPGPVGPVPAPHGLGPDGADASWAPDFAPGNDPRPALPRRRRGNAAPSGDGEPPARPVPDDRHDAPAGGSPAGFGSEPTVAWSMDGRGQQLLAGDSVAGELLREQAGRIGPDPGPRGRGGPVPAPPKVDSDPRGEDFAEPGYPDAPGYPDIYETEVFGPHRAHGDDSAQYDSAEFDSAQYDSAEFDSAQYDSAEFDSAQYDSAQYDLEPFEDTGRGRFARIFQVISSWNDKFAETWSTLTNRSEAREVADDDTRRQWLVLGGQSLGAAVAGMLLFKGFEQMWEMLPWVALALAMVVILGLVALVRVLRRTDDILSTVIAVFVGVFVTLGPLAFLLSTG
uniref:hypothetical protein n=1 Tax=Nocardia paucivorans TaxID=114259 RepID=UPI000309135C|nr:hypothetical protein [Nocardia paucivorans]